MVSKKLMNQMRKVLLTWEPKRKVKSEKSKVKPRATLIAWGLLFKLITYNLSAGQRSLAQ